MRRVHRRMEVSARRWHSRCHGPRRPPTVVWEGTDCRATVNPLDRTIDAPDWRQIVHRRQKTYARTRLISPAVCATQMTSEVGSYNTSGSVLEETELSRLNSSAQSNCCWAEQFPLNLRRCLGLIVWNIWISRWVATDWFSFVMPSVILCETSSTSRDMTS